MIARIRKLFTPPDEATGLAIWVFCCFAVVLFMVSGLSACTPIPGTGGKTAVTPPASLPAVATVTVAGKAFRVVGQFGTEATRERGLMNTRISATQAAVFTWGGKTTTGSFWMLNTPESLSLLWVASGRAIGHVEMPTCKLSCPTYKAPAPYDVAVEAVAGSFASVPVGSLVSFR